MRTPTLAAVVATLLVLAACDDATAPKPLGRFVLTSMNGQPAPFVWLDHTFSSGERRVFSILADTLLLELDGRLRRSEAHAARTYYPDGNMQEQMSGSTTEGTHRRDGDRVILDRVAFFPPYPGWQAVDTLTFRNGGLEQTKRLGIVCATETCPPSRDFLLRYERR